MAVQTKGNPFTHAETTRHSIAGREVFGGCDWCGSTPRTLYRWGASRNPAPLSWRWFCNASCYQSFMA